MAAILSFVNIILLYIGIYALVSRLVNEQSNGLKCVVAFVTTLSLLSFFYFLSLVFHMRFYLLLGIMTVLNGLHLYRSIPLVRSVIKAQRPLYSGVLQSKTFLIVSLSVLFLSLYILRYSSRWGSWDGWGIWNLHAKFLFYANDWKNMFSGKIAYTHSDYPLMLPSLIAFFWKSTGVVTPLVPIIISSVVLIAIPIVAFLGLSQKKVNFFAFAALAIFITDMKFITIGCMQYADTLLALFILVSFVLYKNIKTTNINLLYFVGFIAASACWIKNEGALFYTAFTIAFILFNFRKPTFLSRYFIGSILPLAMLASFKIFFAPSNELVHLASTSGVKNPLLQGDRYLIIIKFLYRLFMDYYMVLVVLIGFTLANRLYFFKSFPFFVLAIVMSGYFFVYVTTPYELFWHLSNSGDRVIHHVYPAMVYLLLLKLSGITSFNAGKQSVGTMPIGPRDAAK